MQTGDPRADPAIVDLIELAGLWLAAQDLAALDRTLERLCAALEQRYPTEREFEARFRKLQALAKTAGVSIEELLRNYRRATVG